jgi:hypothetical protein
MDWRRR